MIFFVLSLFVYQVARDQNHFVFVDLRDRYGVTQIVFHKDNEVNYNAAKTLGRESVITVEGVVVERSNKNANRDTGDVEVNATSLAVLNPSKTPPFLIQDDTDGGSGPLTLTLARTPPYFAF